MSSAGTWYAVHNGRKCGIYQSWEDVKPNVVGFPGASFKKFTSYDEAELFFKFGRDMKSPTANMPCLRTPDSPEAVFVVNGIFVSCYRQKDPRSNIAWQAPAKDRHGEVLALEHALTLIRAEASEVSITLRVTSPWLYNCIINWLFVWKRNGWVRSDGSPVEWKERWANILQLWTPIRTSNRVKLVFEKK